MPSLRESESLSRRRLLQLGAGAALALLGGCAASGGPRLVASRGDLPQAWSKLLPAPWRLTLLEDPAAVLASRRPAPAGGAPPALLQLSDGWLSQLTAGDLQPIGTAALLARLSPQAAAVSRLFAAAGAPTLAWPWSVSPWVLVLRSRPDLAARAAEGWNLLLDPSLRGRLVLPSSPRIAIALVGADPARLRQLRRAALAYDDRDGLNLLLSRKAEAVVLPRQRVLPLLRRDPRLQVILPASGAPLSWNLLLRPASAELAPPLDWLAAILEPPLLPRLLAAGWVPPLPRPILQAALRGFPRQQAELLLPPEPVLQRCTSLPPLSAAQRLELQALWDSAA